MGIREDRREARQAGIPPKQVLQQAAREKIAERQKGWKNPNKTVELPKRFSGVGSGLKHLIRTKYHIAACGGCLDTAAKMDREGPQWCREHLDELAVELHENVKKLGWLSPMQAAAKIVDAGITLSGDSTFYKNLILDAINLYEANL